MNEATNYSLIRRALDLSDEGAWNELHAQYNKFVYYVLRQTNLSGLDIDDVAQEVMVKLMGSLENYDQGKGKFRSWLAQLIRYVAIGAFRKSSASIRRDDAYYSNQTIQLESEESEIDRLIEGEWKQYVSKIAMDKVRQVYRSEHVEIFISSMGGVSARELSQQYNLETQTIYKYRDRIKRRLKLEVTQVIGDLEL